MNSRNANSAIFIVLTVALVNAPRAWAQRGDAQAVGQLRYAIWLVRDWRLGGILFAKRNDTLYLLSKVDLSMNA